MTKTQSLIGKVLLCLVASGLNPAFSFNSGSTGADGAFSPTVNTELTLPPSGVFNFTSINIPAGITVSFKKNALNTPVVILASGDVTIAGTLTVRGWDSTWVGPTGGGDIGDDGVPGESGPGGFGGGRGGDVGNGRGGAGLGPGGGVGGERIGYDGVRCFVFAGCSFSGAGATYSYGSSLLLPLIGGSGGGGGHGGDVFRGSGGGGGGGAILIAASGTVTVSGSVYAHGGYATVPAGAGVGSSGGPGSGGAIRIVATTIAGNGGIDANVGGFCYWDTTSNRVSSCGASGTGVGRVRLEADSFTRAATTVPPFTFGTPGALFVAGFPTLRITSVAGIPVPAVPTGNADVRLAAGAANPVTVQFSTTGVPVGNTVKLTVTPANAPAYSAVSVALTGSTTTATASVSVDIPTGPSVLQATTTYTIVASLGDELSRYAAGERVEKVALSAILGGESIVTLVTVSGKSFSVPVGALAAFPISN